MTRRYRVMTPRTPGPRRRTLLSQRWKDLLSRCKGQATKRPENYAGLELGWATFDEFRAFALANGFSKRLNSPDRIKNDRGYVPGNVRFTTPKENALRALGYSSEPVGPHPDYPDVPF